MPQTEKTKTRKNNVYKNVINLYNKLLSIYFKEYNSTAGEKEEIDEKYNHRNLFIKGFKYDKW